MSIQRMRDRWYAWVILLGTLGSCGGTSDTHGMDRRTRIKFEQYMAEGEELYAVHCLNCHQDRGQGLAQLYPPLAASDYLLADIPRAACIIKYGQAEEIVVNGTTYYQKMNAFSKLTNLEIAEILTYITNSWGNEAGIQPVKEVDQWLTHCEK